MVYQKTIQRTARVDGIGLHSGEKSSICFMPAPENTGIYFKRNDLSGLPVLRAQSRNVTATQLATVLGGELFAISTVEHCMSAVAALQLDNLIIELTGPELPIGDGSADCYYKALQEAGIVEQSALRRYIYVTKPIYYSQGDKYAYVVPHNSLRITSTIEFSHPKIGKQKIELDVTPYSFEKSLRHARTFGFLKEVEAMRQRGLARGGSLENAVVLDDHVVLNPEGLRGQDEFVRHKTMDAIGDLMMLGHPLLGHVTLYKAGHDVMHGFVEKILASPDKYRIVELDSPLELQQGPVALTAT
jgi:UDP-3-O-[3-hydroxymyristoyl] N-acetylglucosamine deacetylase